MGDEKFYWIKLRTDFFAEDSPMDALLSMPNGSEYVCIYLKLCLMTANKGGRLCNQFGEMLIPYNVEKIADDVKHFSIDTVRVAMEIYAKMGLIYQEEDGIIAITGHENLVGSETKWAKLKREERAKLDNVQGKIGQCPSDVQQEIRDKRLEIRDKDIKSKEIEKEVVNRKRFTKPSLEDVEAYIIENNFNVDAQRWLDYYESNGWMVGRNHMKDWRACVRTWARKDAKKAPASQSIVDEWLNA